MKIINVRITEFPVKIFDQMPQIFVTMEDGKEQFLFEFYPDEINFSKNELIGLTIDEAKQLKFQKDKTFLQA